MSIIKTVDFDKTLSQIHRERRGDSSIVRLVFVDGPDHYSIQLQPVFGVLAGMMDCKCRLNGKNAWQVNRNQSCGSTIGSLLLKIADAPVTMSAHEFFEEQVQS